MINLHQNSAFRRYAAELTAALVAYGVLLVGSIELLQHVSIGGPWHDVIALSPMLACTVTAWVILRVLRGLDELQRRIQLEAFGFAFAGTALVTFCYGFLEGLGYPRLSMFVVWPLMGCLWMIGGMLSWKRYR